jgi:hypothetical protein
MPLRLPAFAPSGQHRNFWLGVLNGLFFNLAETLIDPTLVLVALVSRLTASPILIGLVTPLRDGAWYLPQLWLSGYVQNLPRKLVLYRQASVVRVFAWGALAVSVFVLRDPVWLLAVFFLTFGAYAIAAGVCGLPFTEVVAKTIPPHRRVIFFAWRLVLGGLAGIGASVMVQWLLDDASPVTFPMNFGVLIATGWVFVVLGLYAFGSVDEPADASVPPRASFGVQARRAWEIVRADHNFRRFLYLRASLLIAGAAAPFFAVYVQNELNGPRMTGIYLATFLSANLIANVAFGRLSRRLSSRLITLAAAFIGLMMMLVVVALIAAVQWWGLSGAAAALWLVPAFALSGIRDSGLRVSSQPLLLEVSPPAERTLYLGLTNTLLGVALFSTSLSGVIVATFGFAALVSLALAAHIVGLAAAVRMREVGASIGG